MVKSQLCQSDSPKLVLRLTRSEQSSFSRLKLTLGLQPPSSTFHWPSFPSPIDLNLLGTGIRKRRTAGNEGRSRISTSSLWKIGLEMPVTSDTRFRRYRPLSQLHSSRKPATTRLETTRSVQSSQRRRAVRRYHRRTMRGLIRPPLPCLAR
jgi:hypothetical protein